MPSLIIILTDFSTRAIAATEVENLLTSLVATYLVVTDLAPEVRLSSTRTRLLGQSRVTNIYSDIISII